MALANESPVPLDSSLRKTEPISRPTARIPSESRSIRLQSCLTCCRRKIAEVGFDLFVHVRRLSDHEAHRLLVELDGDARMPPAFRCDGRLDVVDDGARIENGPLGIVEKYEVAERIGHDRRLELRLSHARQLARRSPRRPRLLRVADLGDLLHHVGAAKDLFQDRAELFAVIRARGRRGCGSLRRALEDSNPVGQVDDDDVVVMRVRRRPFWKPGFGISASNRPRAAALGILAVVRLEDFGKPPALINLRQFGLPPGRDHDAEISAMNLCGLRASKGRAVRSRGFGRLPRSRGACSQSRPHRSHGLRRRPLDRLGLDDRLRWPGSRRHSIADGAKRAVPLRRFPLRSGWELNRTVRQFDWSPAALPTSREREPDIPGRPPAFQLAFGRVSLERRGSPGLHWDPGRDRSRPFPPGPLRHVRCLAHVPRAPGARVWRVTGPEAGIPSR